MASLKKRLADAKAFLAIYEAPLVDAVDARVAAIKAAVWTPARHDQKVEMVAIAYAMLILFRNDQQMLNGLAKRGRGRAAQPDPARIFVEAIYFDELSTPRALGKVLSRWAAAVRHLDSIKIRPSTVATLAGQAGQGIDVWAKAYAQTRRKPRTIVASPIASTVTIKVNGQSLKKWIVTDARALATIADKLDQIGQPDPKPMNEALPKASAH